MCLGISSYSLISAVQCIWKIVLRLEHRWLELWYSILASICFFLLKKPKQRVLINRISENWRSDESFLPPEYGQKLNIAV